MSTVLERGRANLVRVLPTGSTLPEEAWARRHGAILLLLWAHVPAVLLVGIANGLGVRHSMLEAAVIGFFAAAATYRPPSQEVRAALATLGLVSSSAILVHFSGGLIEMHFHFFVMVAVVTLYQAWVPFLLAIGFVLLHHGVVGAIDSQMVFNHGPAIASPWKWAAVHALFIAGESAAGLAAWKLNELGLERERKARAALEDANADLASAQALSHIGSWDWDTVNDRLWWSDELYRILGFDPAGFTPTYESFIELVHPDDRVWVRALVEESYARGAKLNYVARIVHPDGSERVIHALAETTFGSDGSVIRISGTAQDVTERKSLEEKVEYQAFHDPLTDLANRALFLDRVEHALIRQERLNTPLAVLFLDLDDFKTVNDSLGHSAGDELLVDVAHRIHLSLRPADTVARLGGDEFAILLEDIAGVQDAVLVAQRLREMFSEPFLLDGNQLFVHASVGIAFSLGIEATSPGDLLRNADTAMYEAKRKGKGSYEVFAINMQVAATERLRLRADLQRAIDEDEFFLNFQPIVQPGTGTITGAEALIRWNHPTRGVVPPLDFIPFAEEGGLIVPIGRWVLREACRKAVQWESAVGERTSLTMAVNISAVRFQHSSFVEELLEILDETGLDPSRLVLEITESVLVQDTAFVIKRLSELKEIGIQLAIDDFGTGYSSLSYLRDFPIDILKIDKSFIDSIAMGAEESALARAVIRLGQTLGLKVLAEGVEQAEQADVLRTLGCPLAQGFLFSKPVDGEAIDALIAAGRVEMPVAVPAV